MNAQLHYKGIFDTLHALHWLFFRACRTVINLYYTSYGTKTLALRAKNAFCRLAISRFELISLMYEEQ
ncbi:MAG: hypothetical protein JWQ71_1143 [Pedosphaera sp.]|nr:hypothetical protein [Pedosphaera sp.]